MKPIRVLLVDDHVIFRKGVKTVLSEHEDLQILGEAEDGHQAVDLARRLKPDLILMDINMPNLDGLGALEKILQEDPSIQIVMLTISEEANNLYLAIKKGAKGYILKNVLPDDLYSKIISLQKGDTPISGVIAAKIIQEFQQNHDLNSLASEPEPTEYYEDLSQRENEVLAMVAEGMTNQDIADSLFITESTVKTHLRVIMEKLHLKNRVQAAVYAVEHGLTSKPKHS